ncbi:MAG: hypothetical protein L0Y56_00605 [Nitrospira sp.]|nr:hypothetical protein [Nitrospira sp.]
MKTDTKWWVIHDEDFIISGPYDTESEALAFGDEVFNDGEDIEPSKEGDILKGALTCLYSFSR